MKILIVDDEKFYRSLEMSILQRLDCDVIEACNGKEALEVISREPPDLILMDLNMPEMNGDECCKVIKEDRATGNIPIIMVSVDDKKEHRDKCYAAGCDDFISKPVDKKLLLQKMGAFIDLVERTSLRVSVDSKVNCTVKDMVYTGTIKNISECGVLMESSSEQTIGTIVKLKFNLPLGEAPIELEGAVVRVVDNEKPDSEKHLFEIGVKFVKIPPQCKQHIGEYINVSCLYQI